MEKHYKTKCKVKNKRQQTENHEITECIYC